MMNKRAFSLVELLVVLGILAILTSILLPYLVKIREADRRVQCASNLKSIMDALSKYASENKQFYPRVVYDSAHLPNGYTCFTGADSSDAFSKNSKVAPNDVTASLWLLVHLGYVDAKAFVCPSVISARSDANRRNVGRAAKPVKLHVGEVPELLVRMSLRQRRGVQADRHAAG